MNTRKQFQGSLETMPLSNILQWLADSKKTGTLVITIRDEEKRIILKDGIIVSASSNLEKERFGIIIIKKGYVTQEQVDELLAEGRETGKLLGKLCVEKKFIPEEDVKSILLEQSVAIVESLLHRAEGQFVFLDDTIDALDQIPLSIAMQELFFGSAGKRKEWQRIHELLGSLEGIPKITATQPGNINNLSEFQRSLFVSCDGKHRILDLLAEVDQKDFYICQALADLVEKKWIYIEDPSQELERDYMDRMWQIQISLERRRFLRANMLLDDMLVLFPDRLKDVKPLQEKAKRFLEEDMRRLMSDESIVLYQLPGFDQKKVTSKTFGPQEWFLYSRIDGVTKLKDLILMTGFPREQSKRAIYTLIDSEAVDIKGRVKPKEETEPKTQPETSSAGRSPKGKPEQVKTDTGTDETQPIRAMTVEELDKTYRKYVKLNHYEILNVTRESSQDEVRSSFVRLSRLYHPDMYDRETMDPEVEDMLEELFSMVNHAYRVISNVKARERYDKQLWFDARSPAGSRVALDNRVSEIDEIVLKPKPREAPKKKPEPVVKEKQEQAESDPQQMSDVFARVVSSQPKSGASQTEEEKLLSESIDLFKENKHRDAIAKLETLLKGNARNAQAYYFLSRCQQRLGGNELKNAKDNIKRALILDKENPSYFCQIGRVCISMELLDEADRYLKTALAWDMENREAKYLLEKSKEARQTGFFARFKKKKK